MATARDNLARKQIYIPALQSEAAQLRVAAYCRVSTDSEDQLNSFAAQQSYYNDYIRKHDNWQLAEIYADEGITGTSAAKRDDFQRMLLDCRKGRIDKVLVKSISRFARNTKECLESIRELKSLGISVFFEEHNIDTRMVTSEMLTAVLASCAQAESESISKNMRWSYQKRMLTGTYIPSSVPYGYRLNEKQIVVEPDEAVVVARIFTLYLAGYSKLKIAAELNSRDICTRKGNPWDYCAIRYILRNERYAGNSLWQKTYKTEDFPPKKLRNYGERERYYAENTHPAIIEMDAFSAVKELLEERRSFYKEGIRTANPVRDRLICGHCGSRFRGKTVEGNQYWCCRTHSNDASSCPKECVIGGKVMKNNGELPQVLIQNNHPGIVTREVFYEVQEEMKRRTAARSPSAKSATGRTSYASKYALSERLVCGECGTLYRRCTWTIRGKKKIVWRCVSRLDHGTKYCKESPTMEETALQRAIMDAVNSTMDSKEDIVKGITETVILMLKPKENAVFTLGEVKRRIAELTAEFDRLFNMDGSEEKYEKRFSEITQELAELKKQRDEISAQLRNNQGIQAKLNRFASAAERMDHRLTEWDEELIRQMIHTVEVISADRIRVVLTDGTVIMQEVHNQ